MCKDVAEYVRWCDTCQRTKVEQAAPVGLMGRRTTETPWKVVASNIMGPFPKSKNGYEFILVIQDLFTKWIECYPLRKTTGKKIREILDETIVNRWGAPHVLLTDNGTEFINRKLKAFAQELAKDNEDPSFWADLLAEVARLQAERHRARQESSPADKEVAAPEEPEATGKTTREADAEASLDPPQAAEEKARAVTPRPQGSVELEDWAPPYATAPTAVRGGSRRAPMYEDEGTRDRNHFDGEAYAPARKRRAAKLTLDG
ncbi:reverse ribonuclease integrase [Lasius niger]|uniref:Reverse ribonuclease integrase n=1 Tax=Lasius niger TaxID=67767 RepID=A0A0J7K709_LASNI|nr:reverse ribonuclease integrase [Lasius niger]